MKKAMIISAVVFMTMLFAACPKQSGQDTAGATAETVAAPNLNIALTQELVDRYATTLPAFAKIAAEAGEMYDTVSAALLANPAVVKLLRDDGWQDAQEFVSVHGKIFGVRTWITASDALRGQPEESLDVFANQFRREFNQSHVLEAERKLLWANEPKLLAAIQQAADY
jgi:hypothetical protein